jgi:hypothetical protein
VRIPSVSAVAMCVLAVSATVWAPGAAADTPLTPTTDQVISTHFYRIQERIFALPSRTAWVTATRGNTVLALGQDSGVMGNQLLGGTVLTYPISSFDVGTSTVRDLGSIDFAPVVGAGSRMRILDFEYFPELQGRAADTATVLVSFSAYSRSQGCRRSYAQQAEIDLSGRGQNRLGKRWFTMPCIRPINPPDGTIVGPVLHMSGGRIALVPPSERANPKVPEIYFSTGDFEVLRTKAKQLPVGTRRLLSSILRITENGKVTVVASGLRNPQGLTSARLDKADALVATSHGPRGGDELIRVQPGADYGWPTQSYGTVYDYKPTPAQSKPKVEGALPSATLPEFAWVPSIAPSAVIQLHGRAFGKWWGASATRPDGDLLVSGMASQTLYRVRWQDGAVRYVESIPMGMRIRSLTQLPNGFVVAGTDTGDLVVLNPVSAWSSTGSHMSSTS